MPRGVRLARLAPAPFKDERRAREATSPPPAERRVTLQIVGETEDDESLLEFVDRLFAHPAFERPNLSREARVKSGGLGFTIAVAYLPAMDLPGDGVGGDARGDRARRLDGAAGGRRRAEPRTAASRPAFRRGSRQLRRRPRQAVPVRRPPPSPPVLARPTARGGRLGAGRARAPVGGRTGLGPSRCGGGRRAPAAGAEDVDLRRAARGGSLRLGGHAMNRALLWRRHALLWLIPLAAGDRQRRLAGDVQERLRSPLGGARPRARERPGRRPGDRRAAGSARAALDRRGRERGTGSSGSTSRASRPSATG